MSNTKIGEGRRIYWARSTRGAVQILAPQVWYKQWVSDGTLWPRFSMLRFMILAKEGLNIKTINANSTIQTWLKRIGANHKAKQAHIFSKEEVGKCIREASDIFIVQKLVLLVCIYTDLGCDASTRLERDTCDSTGNRRQSSSTTSTRGTEQLTACGLLLLE